MNFSIKFFGILILLISTIRSQFIGIELEKVKELRFQQNIYTNSRRTIPIPQLNCEPELGNAGCPPEFLPQKIICQNSGFDINGVVWTCSANIDSRIEFSEFFVECEGFNFPGDSKVLQGSCGLTFGFNWVHQVDFDGGIIEDQTTHLEIGKKVYFSSQKQTTSINTERVPQMNCIGGSSYCDPHFLPKQADCEISSFDYIHSTFIWDCQAEVDKHLKLGKAFVSCEGFRGPNDEYVLKDSCAFYYELDYKDNNIGIIQKTPYLSFKSQLLTKSSSGNSVDQLQCKGQCPINKLPTTVSCYNLNHQKQDAENTNWYCEGDTGSGYVIDKSRVHCNPIENLFTEFSSCYLEYRLVVFDQNFDGENREYHQQRFGSFDTKQPDSGIGSLLFILIFFGILIFCCWKFSSKKGSIVHLKPKQSDIETPIQRTTNSQTTAQTFNRTEFSDQKLVVKKARTIVK
ncbi:hypothetical protein M0811_04510 [Anaeramoeba ignava]|uniref:Store-operated calcium entry-associated regulatory factor n=1 Tax=Anaeramoeba ignava TaxID=1746090 RepID=A0A9Q0LTR9_ANAIG|nr:hypothetical protein M0811_04510 [Anaeramoeba ignava]